MRQAGYLAACGIFALDNNIDRLHVDHKNAKIIEQELKKCSWVKDILEVKTNIIVFNVESNQANYYVNILKDHNILALALDVSTIRFVTHLNISDKMIEDLIRVLRKL